MYIAELQGKFTPNEERKEDILTSDVFSFMKYANREIFLFHFLESLGFECEKKELSEAQFIFWPSYEDGTEPDLVLIVGDYYFLIEAKFRSGFGEATDSRKHQLAREIEGGRLEAKNLNKKFFIFAVTAHYTQKQFESENPDIHAQDIIWVNWHHIAVTIEEALISKNGKNLDIETKSFAEDLLSLIEKKKLRNFAGLKILEHAVFHNQIPLQIFFNPITAQYRGDFLGFSETLCSFPKIHPTTKAIFLSLRRIYFRFESKTDTHFLPDKIFFGGNNA